MLSDYRRLNLIMLNLNVGRFRFDVFNGVCSSINRHTNKLEANRRTNKTTFRFILLVRILYNTEQHY